jgi:uncharacterized protein
MLNIGGVDFGAKMAGTTALTYMQDGTLMVCQSGKGQDADNWLKQKIVNLNISCLYIDAPLSLPNAYFGKGNNYFYREADIKLKAMSPLFLGGLTARAMQLKHELKQNNIDVHEVYPGGLIRTNEMIDFGYNKKENNTISDVWIKLKNCLPFPINYPPENYHQLDSILCWYIGWKHVDNKATPFGIQSEGIIWV